MASDEKTGLLADSVVSTPAQEEDRGPPWYKSCRYTLAFLGFLGFWNVYALRVNLSDAIVPMSDEFNWGNAQSTVILSAFFYGYIVTQLPGGWLATRFGAKMVFGFGVLTTSALTLLTPLAAKKYPVLLALRVIEGFGEGVTYPAMHSMWARWAPPQERSQLATLCYSGAFLGTVIALPLSGALADSYFLGGWPSVFYVFGTLGCLWFVAWMLLAANSPDSHRRITAEERAYIKNSISRVQGRQERVPTPWLSIFTSVPVWAIIVMHFCQNWGFYTLLTCLPTYFNDVLRFNLQDGSFNASLPYLALFLVTLLGGSIADYLRTNNILSTGIVRKLMNTLAYTFTAVFLVLAGYVPYGHNGLAVAFLTISQGGNGFAQSGFNVNHLDVSPRFAGILMGITNCVATIPGFVAPTVAGIMAPCALCSDIDAGYNGTSYYNQYFQGPNKCPPSNKPLDDASFKPCTQGDATQQWRGVFWLSAGIFIFGAVFYIIFGSGKPQRWNGLNEERVTEVRVNDDDKEDEVNEPVGRGTSLSPVSDF